MIAIDAAKKGLILSYRFNGDVPDLIVQDQMKLRQVLLNLLDNAVKCTQTGEIKINISSREIKGVHVVHFAVQDTGMGIPIDLIDNLFLPFGEKNTLQIRKYGDSGLELAISKRLVELMEGKIWVESVESIGSIFHFTIKADSGPEIRK